MLIPSTAALISSTSAANANINFASLQPKLRAAETQYLIPIIGTALYNHMTAWLAANPTGWSPDQPAPNPEPEEHKLLPYLQRVIAPWALYHYVPIAEVSISDGGVFRSETETTKTAYQNQVTNLRRELMHEAQQAETMLLQYLEALQATSPEGDVAPEDPEPTPTDLKSLWTQSPEFTRYRTLFITNALEFNELFHSQQPYRNYYALRHLLYDCQFLILPGILTPGFYQVLLEKQKTEAAKPTGDGWTDDEKQLLLKVKKYLAYIAVFRGIAAQALSWDERGLTVYLAANKATHDDDSKRSLTTPAHLNHYAAEISRQAEEWKKDLSFFLDTKASNLVFKEYYEAKQEERKQAEPESLIPDSRDHNTFGLF